MIENLQNRAMTMNNKERQRESVTVVVSCKLMQFANFNFVRSVRSLDQTLKVFDRPIL